MLVGFAKSGATVETPCPFSIKPLFLPQTLQSWIPLDYIVPSLSVFVLVFFLFQWHPWCLEVPGPGIMSEPELQSHQQLQQHWSLKLCTGPGIKPASPQKPAGSLTHCATGGTLSRCSLHLEPASFLWRKKRHPLFLS